VPCDAIPSERNTWPSGVTLGAELRRLTPALFEFLSNKIGTTDSRPLGLGVEPGTKISWVFEALVGAREAQLGGPVVVGAKLQTSTPGDADILGEILKGSSQIIGGILVTVGSWYLAG